MTELPARRERLIVLGGIAGILALAWWYLIDMAAMMKEMPTMFSQPVWDAGYFTMVFLMWAIMMLAMMLPSVIPVMLLFLRVARHSGTHTQPLLRTGLFACGYLLAWTGFSLLATILQWGLAGLRLLSGDIAIGNPLIGGGLLIVAGLYQLTPLKNACLEHCRGPVAFLTRRWRRTRWGALRMGIEHGLYCIGCCWVIMALLFVGGVMNLLWIAALTLFVLIEKLLPVGLTAGRIAGAIAAMAGLSMILAHFVSIP